MRKRTAKALAECGRWLSYCLRMGWSKESLDELEKIWWKYHKWNGELK